MSDDFEDRLRDSLQHRAGQVDSVKPNGQLGRPASVPRRHSAAILASVAATVAVVLATALGIVLTRDRQEGAPSGGTVVSQSSDGPVSSATGSSPWQVSTVLIGPDALRTSDNRIVAPAGSAVLLVVEVQPAADDLKGYLQQQQGSGWVTVGPHNTDRNGVEFLRLIAPDAGQSNVFRFLIVAAQGYTDGYSGPVTIQGE